MSKTFDDLIEKRQQRLQARDRQLRWLWIALIAIGGVALAFNFLREDPTTGPVNINTANVETLCHLPEIGPEMAQRIIAARPFSNPDDLLKVKGIGPANLAKIKPRLRFGQE